MLALKYRAPITKLQDGLMVYKRKFLIFTFESEEYEFYFGRSCPREELSLSVKKLLTRTAIPGISAKLSLTISHSCKGIVKRNLSKNFL